jgi:hypothetical protein
VTAEFVKILINSFSRFADAIQRLQIAALDSKLIG